MSTPGLLQVTMQPRPGLPASQFHDWYNNEHGVNRLRLPHIFTNGLRYRAIDGETPEFAAQYDVTDMKHLETDIYTTLRANRTKREAETIGQVDVYRTFYDLIHTRSAPNFVSPENLSNEEAEGLVATQVIITLKDAEGAADAYAKWFIEEHAVMLSKVPGWRRSRLYKTSYLEGATKAVFFAQHDYDKVNGLGGPEHKASMDTKWRTEVFDKYVADKARREFGLFYIFGPASRDLHSLSQLDPAASFTSPDGKTVTTTGPNPSIKSFVTTADQLEIPIYLEGNTSPEAPTVAFSNSLLTSHRMWDRFVEILKKERPDLRLLRYDTRGRHAIPQPPKKATMEMLADDLLAILDALRITKLHTLIGVSMGGATTLNFAIKYPERVSKFIACDCNYKSTEANTKAWGDRSKLAEEGGINELAEMTVKRWFHPLVVEDEKTTKWMIDEVAQNDIQGFTHSCTALCDFNLEASLDGCQVPALLVAGEGDGNGAIAKILDGVKGRIGQKGAELRLVPDAGHLPMYERPQAFWDAIKSFI
ncbi:hypothetical protein NLU13_4257 [Sarocladium strictum]|uniref:AB hydrolase-1 domain-containing protein n=1 Tax=Sarocladium strictum TaxID=5046 RepID=A0AA39GII9_SARSR|nr:hypothetical protein NLU13_4257 [Sarocladium strictum]